MLKIWDNTSQVFFEIKETVFSQSLDIGKDSLGLRSDIYNLKKLKIPYINYNSIDQFVQL